MIVLVKKRRPMNPLQEARPGLLHLGFFQIEKWGWAKFKKDARM
jgi:hypothetical protein